jgi:phosphate/sulfate permease
LERAAFNIVRLDRRMAIAARLAQAIVILGYVAFGYLTSMNQALVGSVIGVGFSRRKVGRTPMIWGAVRMS